MGLWNTNGSPNSGQKTRPSDSWLERAYQIVDFAVPVDHRVKIKESEKRDKYLDLARQLKKLWNMKVMVIPVVIGVLGMISKGLVKGLKELESEDEQRPFKLQYCYDQPEYWEEFLEICEELLLFRLQWKTIS